MVGQRNLHQAVDGVGLALPLHPRLLFAGVRKPQSQLSEDFLNLL